LARAGRYLDFMTRMLGWWAADPTGLAAADRWAAERFRAAASSVLAQNEAIAAINADLDLLLGPLVRRVVHAADSGQDLVPPPTDSVHEAALAAALDRPLNAAVTRDTDAISVIIGESAEPVLGDSAVDGAGHFADEVRRIDDDDGVEQTAGDIEEDDAISVGDDASVPQEDTQGQDPGPSEFNNVVWIAEAESPDVARSRRRLRFSIATSPIVLGHNAAWREFLSSTPRLVLTSGTLQVADAWDFIRRRLGLGDTVPAEVLQSPFDFATQARLVALADFPSWAEHPTRAVRTVAHQVSGWARLAAHQHPGGGLAGGAMVLTTSKATAAAISEAAAPLLAGIGIPLATTETLGNARAVERFATDGGVLVGTRGLWQGVDVEDPQRLRLVWINKLPFAPFADPVIAARRAAEGEHARRAGATDPERIADESYYLPLAALALRQAVGRLIRSTDHRGVIIIGDAKLAGSDARRRLYRRVFLGSLDRGLRADGPTGDIGAGNVMSMTDAWRHVIAFGANAGFLDPNRATAALEPEALDRFVDLPEMALIRGQILDPDEEADLRARDPGSFAEEVVERCEAIAQVLSGTSVRLHAEQRRAIAAVARGTDLLALLPTGFGKSYCYQLPALVLSGVTIVVSPLVSLMVDQAMGLGATIGSMVRALTGPMRESNSRLGKTQVAETLRGEVDHGIRLVYLSPERLADARFRSLVEEGVERGIVRRIVIDEAHTLVDWGDDFRPAFRRLDRWLDAMRRRHPDVQISAFTATANATVREGIRTRLFGLPATPPTRESESGLVTVEATPLRPELSIWRRRLAPGGPNAVAGLIEAVADTLEQHAIFYCLTVREVERVYASLRDYLGDEQSDRVLRYHGRLSQAEKAAVALAFRTAPREHQDGFRPMIVVATSAFGLGVDRDDIRCVFCISPPTDLAALYQQLGRAGRDSTQQIPGSEDVTLNAAIALITQRSWRTAAWMANQDLNVNTLRGLGDLFLAAAPMQSCAAVDPDDIAQVQIAADINAHRLAERARTSVQVAEEYRSGAMRALAALAVTGGLEDLGDIPDRVRIAPGELVCDDELWQQVIATALADPNAAGSGVDLCSLHAELAGTVGYAEACPTVSDLWTGVAAAHDWGWLDVSQQVTNAHLVVYRVVTAERPAGFDTEVTSRSARVTAELARLRAWFEDTRCAHLGFAEAFGTGSLPPGTCATARVRCSSHWNSPTALAADPTPQPALYRAFFTPRPQPSAATAEGRADFERRLRRHIGDLLWQEYRGLTAVMLRRVLHGEDSWYSRASGRFRRLWPSLLYHKARGAMIGVRLPAVEAALAQMAASGQVVEVGDGRWRWSAHVAADEARSVRLAAATKGSTVKTKATTASSL
jgi:RecQ family ATP-dependent DNA helicase